MQIAPGSFYSPTWPHENLFFNFMFPFLSFVKIWIMLLKDWVLVEHEILFKLKHVIFCVWILEGGIDLNSKNYRVFFEGPDVEYDGIPYVYVADKMYICHLGKDKTEVTRQKLREKSQEKRMKVSGTAILILIQ